MKDNNLYKYENIISEMYDFEVAELENRLCDEHTFSDIFEKKIKKIIAKNYYKSMFYEFGQIVLILLISIVLVSAIASPNTYVKAAKKIFEKLKEHYEIQLEEQRDGEKLERYKLNYVPNGYILLTNDYIDYGGIIEYVNSNDNTLSLMYNQSDNKVYLNGENVKYIEFDYNGYHIYYLEGDKTVGSSMTWESYDHNVIFTLFGNISKSEMLKIIDGIEVE